MAVIEPNKCIIEDLEVLSFETEEQLNYYTVWHEALVDKRRELSATSERERQIIRNEIARKKRQLIGSIADETTSKTSRTRHELPKPESKPSTVPRAAPVSKAVLRPCRSTNQSTFSSHQRQGAVYPPKGLQIFNPATQGSKQGMKYKLTKLYNKYRGRQTRRNFVLEKQQNARIELEIAKSYINPWMAYTALQALRLIDSNVSSMGNTSILTSLAQPMTTTASPSQKQPTVKKSKVSSKKQQAQALPHATPMHLVYIDPVNLITYSNKINPQQVADYRQKSHLLPSSATSKKSSAASYDAYEIMEVLANTNKTNVTITRNANRPTSAGANTSVYSHSVNSNTPGIVSTQLHLQARSYLDSMSKFYAEEAERLAKEQERLDQEPHYEELIGRYLHLN